MGGQSGSDPLSGRRPPEAQPQKPTMVIPKCRLPHSHTSPIQMWGAAPALVERDDGAPCASLLLRPDDRKEAGACRRPSAPFESPRPTSVRDALRAGRQVRPPANDRLLCLRTRVKFL